MNAPALVQQFTHLVHPDRSYRLSYLLRQIADKTGKIHNNRKQTNKNKKNNEQTDSICDKTVSFQKSNGFIIDLPRSNCLLCSVVQAVVLSLLLLLLRWSRELLTNSGLLCTSGSFFLVVYPDVWLMKQKTLLLGACAI